MVANLETIKPKSNRGGARPGSGRPKGAKDKATRDAGATIGELARKHGPDALATLAQIAMQGESESARIAAANALLDRGYGKPPQSVDVKNSDGSLRPVPAPAIVSALERKHRDGG